MNKIRKLTAKLPDGTILTRSSHRDYQYAVAVRPKDKPGAVWVGKNWCSRHDLAVKAANAFDLKLYDVYLAKVDQ